MGYGSGYKDDDVSCNKHKCDVVREVEKLKEALESERAKWKSVLEEIETEWRANITGRRGIEYDNGLKKAKEIIEKAMGG